MSEEKAKEQTLPGDKCRHHWLIQPANGPISEGVCQVCGENREFKNSVEASTWGDEKTGRHRGGFNRDRRRQDPLEDADEANLHLEE